MISLVRLKITDFMRIGTAEIAFEPDGTYLLMGKNNDEPGADSNGCGKSAILDAIAWALFGMVPRQIQKDDVIRRGAKRCVVELDLDIEAIEVLNICRARGSKAGLWAGFETERSLTASTDSETQAVINKILKSAPGLVGFNDFLNTVYLSSTAVQVFTSRDATSADRMAFLSRFLGLDVLTDATKAARKSRTDAETRLKTEKATAVPLQEELDGIPSQGDLDGSICATKVKKEKSEEELAVIRKDIRALDKKSGIEKEFNAAEAALSDFESELGRSLAGMREQVRELEEEVSGSDIDKELTAAEKKFESLPLEDDLKEDLDGWRKGLAAENSNVQELTSEIEAINKDINQIKAQLDKAITCPECETPLMVSDGVVKKFNEVSLKSKLTKAEKKFEGLINIRVEGQQGVKEAQDRIAETEELLGQVQEVYQGLESLKAKKEARTGAEKRLKSLNKRLKDETVRLDAKRKELQTVRDGIEVEWKAAGKDLEWLSEAESHVAGLEMVIKEFERQIHEAESSITHRKDLQSRIDAVKTGSKSLRNEWAGYKYWEDGFPAIRRDRIEGFLPVFEDRTNSLLADLEVNERIRFDTVKLRSGKQEGDEGAYKATFNIAVLDGRDERDYATYSEGEKKRIAVCITLALREASAALRESPFGFVMLDEILDGLDETGADMFVDLINGLPGQRLLVSHSDWLKNKFPRSITVVRRDGVSGIE